ncbi:hypothetical protein EBE87_17895 [Pseudoroseomonas wenyumeiae]|uniref:DUF4252 domain-containing protein n=1 Tax=Teichococcus wenyumeiae TaxID=2478470 RepID=A0A3A9JWI5_9PROT|nr:hypothetical protein [Pseudoroseomonas wenyumeiae]RKK05138.1 hypothetical protein D6Z83_05690 [Pseudoroseomonas wenyumeiae]RMI20028.1 hypothetical protein EBE87_17895 [Pseudoroseomonas wenyumeiae]
MNQRFRITTLAVAAMLAAGTARADEISEGLDRARQLYGQGDVSGALTETNFALNALHQKRNALYAALFPAAPAGWTLEDSSDDGAGSALAAQMLGGGVLVERTYTRSDDSSIKATVLVDSPMIQALASMVNNPAMLGKGAKRVRIGGDNAVLQRDEESAELTLARGNVAIKLEGSGIKDPEVLTQLMTRFDLAKLARPQGK